MIFGRAVKRGLMAVGVRLERYRPCAVDILERMLKRYRVDMVFDVGANIGQSGEYFRSIGYAGRMVSFEPVAELASQLRAKAGSDAQWQVENLALGKVAGRAEINVSGGHAGASSFLELTENVAVNAPDQRVVRKEAIEVATLDDMLAKHYPCGDRCFLKLDVQGYEKAVLEGGFQSLHRVVGLKIELSLVENYKGETMLPEMLPFLYGLGFRPVSFEDGWSNARTGELFQLDCILFRTDAP